MHKNVGLFAVLNPNSSIGSARGFCTIISRPAQTDLDRWQNRQSLRVEWYIIILILVEIVLMIYDL